ncbi:MAG TPA: RsmE family RNA methyltransferase [Chitinophagaceae bacterium]|nr:RsmE family RNA methyltransferase [Chitinophagaceae bacterium]
MALPFFYIENYIPNQSLITLTEEESKHIITVLRMKVGEQMHLTDGGGNLLTAEIMDAHKKKCVVKVIATNSILPPAYNVTVAVSLLKNTSRFEWLLEKITEIGVSEIIPLICTRTERQAFRRDRMKNILVSAMLQSQQCRLPVLREPTAFNDLVASRFENYNKLIAHCSQDEKSSLLNREKFKLSHFLILIGPEGDFTQEEITSALDHQFVPVSLGDTRLRTETAGVVAATLLTIK